MGDAIDFANRRLCPDGGCIGLIGADGRCKVCGRRDQGGARAVAVEEAETPDDLEADELAAAPADDDHDADADAGFDPGRELCPDGACIGVIGSNGRCRICGSPSSRRT